MTPNRGITLGHLFGIRIALDASVIFIALLITFSLGSGVFPAWHPEWSSGMSWLVALVTALLFLLSILAHEMAHALVAKAYGIPVSSITLFMFGGIANIESHPESPGSEAVMALVGPMTSFLLGIALVFIAGSMVPAASEDPLASIASAGPLATLLLWLGPVNILLAVFNMLPGFPLDGGRVLRAALWKASNSLEKATRWAAYAGQGLGWLLILAGIAMAFGMSVPLLGRGFVPGLWTAFIGWFLSGAAAASYEDVVVRRALEDVPVKRLMRRDMPPRVREDESVAALVDEHLVHEGTRLLMVERDGNLVGLIDARDVRRIERAAWDRTRAGELARPLSELPRVTPSADVYQTMRRMVREQSDPILVCDDQGDVVGLLSLADVTRWLELQTDRAATRFSLVRSASHRA